MASSITKNFASETGELLRPTVFRRITLSMVFNASLALGYPSRPSTKAN